MNPFHPFYLRLRNDLSFYSSPLLLAKLVLLSFFLALILLEYKNTFIFAANFKTKWFALTENLIL